MVPTKKINPLSLLIIFLLLPNCNGNKSRSFEKLNNLFNMSEERECRDFHFGSFYTETSVNGINYKSNFSRDNSNIQIEEFEGSIDSSYVKWVNDCEMILSRINPKKMNEKKNILIKILTTSDSSYTYEYSYLGQSKKFKAKAIKIR